MFGHRNVPCGLQILNPLFSLRIFAALSSVFATMVLPSSSSSPFFCSCFVVFADLSSCFISLLVPDFVGGGAGNDDLNNGDCGSNSGMFWSSRTFELRILVVSCIKDLSSMSLFIALTAFQTAIEIKYRSLNYDLYDYLLSSQMMVYISNRCSLRNLTVLISAVLMNGSYIKTKISVSSLLFLVF